MVRNLETGAEHWTTMEHLAMHMAEGMVGNRSVAVLDGGAIMLYGPGDGSTSVMVRRFTRDLVFRAFPDVVLPVA